MKSKFFAVLVVFAFALNAFGAAFANTKTNKKVKPTNALAALLPASDGIFTVDLQKVLNEAAPQILSGKPQMLTDINAKIDEVRDKTGLDLRQFEQIAVGVAMKQISPKEVDLEPLVLARGKYNANALTALAKLASKGKYREEKVGARTVYIFSIKEIAENAAQNRVGAVEFSTPIPPEKSWFEKAIDRMIDGLMKEIAVTSYDGNTLAFGSAARVRETLNTKTRVNADLLNSINRKPNAIVSFGAKLPNGLSNFIDLDNDEFGMTLDSIRQVSGAMELINGDTAVSVTAKTAKVDQSQKLLETLQGLQMLGKTLIGGSKGADKQVYSRMIENAKITRSLLEVSLDLQVPQSDIDILLNLGGDKTGKVSLNLQVPPTGINILMGAK
ncbi:MAG: hypothetical protein LH472_02225 [Pyrinomonadaceae bacterium]|nr:hypothetical protein [Pyrinomonadaceae bacterium]